MGHKKNVSPENVGSGKIENNVTVFSIGEILAGSELKGGGVIIKSAVASKNINVESDYETSLWF